MLKKRNTFIILAVGLILSADKQWLSYSRYIFDGLVESKI